MKATSGVDFSHYKPKTFARRIQRRMLLCKLAQLADYAAYLQANPAEVKALYEEILIHVTSFFRDPQAFELLKTRVFPAITQHKSAEMPIRIWVAGCATGEEVYSIAICLLEFLAERVIQPPIQIFASDISESSIARARSGIYAENQMVDVSPERRRRFFYPVEGGYHINKAVRELCVFARQNLGGDPPFSNLDLISCRNVLIYLSDSLQQRIMPLFHYSLNGTGFLFLGKSESTGKQANLFTVVDKKHRIYAKNPTATSSTFSWIPSSYPTVKTIEKIDNRQPLSAVAQELDLQEKVDRLIAEHYTPIGVVIDDKMQVLQLRGEIDRYLKLVSGVVNFNLFNLVRSGLLVELREAIEQSQRDNVPVAKNGLHLEENDRHSFNLQVIPFKVSAGERFLILFKDAQIPAIRSFQSSDLPIPQGDLEREILRLRQELLAANRQRTEAQEYLRAVIKEQEHTNQDLKVANEEILSSNEELQSANEELETAKEEIQSTNEELTTTNDELHRHNLELDLVNSDLTNLLASINIPILMLTNDLRIRRFTPMAQQLFNFVPTDNGRPLSDITTNLNIPDLNPLILEVLETLSVKELEVQTHNGYWYRLRIRPYRTTENRIDGVVLVLVDIDTLKQLETERLHLLTQEQLARQSAEAANRAKDDFLSNLSHELRNPLTAIIGWAQLIQSHQLDDATVTRGLATIYRNAKAQSQLVEDMLDLSRINSGKLHLSSISLDLVPIVHAALESVQLDATAKSISIGVNLAPTTIMGDVVRLGQVVVNLLTNAIKFTPTGGRIEISLATIGTFAQLRVSDTGQGIRAELLPYIFDRFHQGDAGRSKSTPGLGLGLSIVRHIVELHGGTVRAESAGVGQGTTIFIELPLALSRSDLARTGSALPIVTPAVYSLAGLSILAVDDEVDILELMKYILENVGAEVTSVTSAKAALATLVAAPGKYDVLLADIGMPEEDGFALIRQVRALAAGAGGQIPAAAITAYVTDRERQLALDAGFQVHLAKPIDPAQLIQVVVNLTGRVRMGNE